MKEKYTILAGTKFTDILESLDVFGAIERKEAYRKEHGLPTVYDVYIRNPNGTWTIKEESIAKEINK